MNTGLIQMQVNWTRFFAACLVIFISGCTEPPQEPLRIASSPWPGYEPLYLARDLGYLDENTVNLFELPSADITMESFRNGSTDMATLTLDETLELLHDGTKLRILLIMDISNGGDAVMVNPEIKTLADLKGKRISIVNIPLGLYMLSRTLDAAGLTRSDVEVYPMSESRQEQFYLQGKADAVITFEPVKTRLASAGMQVLFDSSDIPNEIFDMLIVHEDVYNTRRDELCKVVKEWFRTLEYIRDHPQDAANRISRRLGVDSKEYEKMMQGIILPSPGDNQRMLGGDSPTLLVPAKKLSAIMQQEQQLSGPVDAKLAIDNSFSSCLAP